MNKSGLSQSRNLPHMAEFMASHKRRTHTLQTEVSKLYDKTKNSYSRKFQMKMQLMN